MAGSEAGNGGREGGTEEGGREWQGVRQGMGGGREGVSMSGGRGVSEWRREGGENTMIRID